VICEANKGNLSPRRLDCYEMGRNRDTPFASKCWKKAVAATSISESHARFGTDGSNQFQLIALHP
jgi:hypothetical protein